MADARRGAGPRGARHATARDVTGTGQGGRSSVPAPGGQGSADDGFGGSLKNMPMAICVPSQSGPAPGRSAGRLPFAQPAAMPYTRGWTATADGPAGGPPESTPRRPAHGEARTIRGRSHRRRRRLVDRRGRQVPRPHRRDPGRLPRRAPARPRRDGRGLPRAADQPEPRGRLQGPPARPADERDVSGPVRVRGLGRGQAQRAEHRPHLQPGDDRRPALHRDGVRPGDRTSRTTSRRRARPS